ncbi:Protein tssc1 [Boothiomyces sp. JEL0838]|nr:Protein tssc1 [Boothiomyces sp. JEL0838]
MSVCGLAEPARCLVPQVGETEKNRWLVGTYARANNKVYLIDYNEDDDQVTSTEYNHNSRVSFIATGSNKNLIITGHDDKATLWAMNETELESISQLPDTYKIKGCSWSNNGKQVIGYGNETMELFNLDKSMAFLQPQQKINCPEQGINAVQWNPHDDKQIGIAANTAIYEIDLRSGQKTCEITKAHELLVRNLDYNLNKPYHFASCGDDCMIRIWDARNTSKCLLQVSDHSHWVWGVSFNKYHDQLLLSCSSDCQVNLQSVVSVSSALLHESVFSPGQEEENKTTDGLVHSYDQHEHSVYSAAWSPADPWIFASVSFDGRVVVNFVPPEQKYKIIL